MEKKGVSLVVASVLLIALALGLALVIYHNMQLVVVSLAPEVDCYGMEFRADIVREHGTQIYFLDVVNVGNFQIDGFYIKATGEGESFVYEEVLADVERGATERIKLAKQYAPGNYFVVPRVLAEDLEEESFYKACKDIYGERVVIE